MLCGGKIPKTEPLAHKLNREVAEMFGGEFKHSLDAKNRIFIPSKMRDDLGATFVVAQDVRAKCIKLYSIEGWEEYLAPIYKQNRNLQERVLRYLNSTMEKVTPDSQGRITLPKALVAFAEIEDRAIVVGCGKYAEIWAEDIYMEEKKNVDLAKMLEEMESFGL